MFMGLTTGKVNMEGLFKLFSQYSFFWKERLIVICVVSIVIVCSLVCQILDYDCEYIKVSAWAMFKIKICKKHAFNQL